MNVKFKRCPTCGIIKPVSIEHFYINKHGHYDNRCKECRVIQSNKYYRENTELILKKGKLARDKFDDEKMIIIRAKQQTYRETHRKQLSATAKKWRERNRAKMTKYIEKARPSVIKRHKLHTKLLTDFYIKRILYRNFKLTVDKITPEMIELKREQLTLNRELRKLKRRVKNGINRAGD